jgi:hypothetical protein
MAGESYPENSFEFYRPILSWISEFLGAAGGPVTLDTHLSYLNTGSTKCIMDILDLLEDAFRGGRQVTVNWYYDGENERALETAEEFQEEVTLPFHLSPISEEP